MSSEAITRNDLTAILNEVLPEKMPSDTVYAGVVSATIGRAYGSHVAVTAPTISGYKFLCWTLVSSNGWVGSVYPASPLSQTSDMWNAQTGQSGSGRIDCIALYIPTTT